MANYSNSSSEKLNTAHPDLIAIFTEVVKIFDNTIVYGYRDPALQFELYKKGRSFVSGQWIVTDKGRVVTYKDGTDKKSNHNYNPSKAIDAIPYYSDAPHLRWSDTKRMYYFAGHVKAIAHRLFEEGIITHKIIFGGDWDNDTRIDDQTFMDLAHYEIK